MRKHLKREGEEINKVLFFPVLKLPVESSRYLKRSENRLKTSFSELYAAISVCKKSLDMCLFLFTLADMASLAIRLMQEGVRVRVIVDHNNVGLAGCQVPRLCEAGVRVLSRKQSGCGYMHHKFALVDSRVVITGSFNWTRQPIYNNNDNVIISSNKKLVEPYVAEFERLWEAGGKNVPIWRALI